MDQRNNGAETRSRSKMLAAAKDASQKAGTTSRFTYSPRNVGEARAEQNQVRKGAQPQTPNGAQRQTPVTKITNTPVPNSTQTLVQSSTQPAVQNSTQTPVKGSTPAQKSAQQVMQSSIQPQQSNKKGTTDLIKMLQAALQKNEEERRSAGPELAKMSWAEEMMQEELKQKVPQGALAQIERNKNAREKVAEKGKMLELDPTRHGVQLPGGKAEFSGFMVEPRAAPSERQKGVNVAYLLKLQRAPRQSDMGLGEYETVVEDNAYAQKIIQNAAKKGGADVDPVRITTQHQSNEGNYNADNGGPAPHGKFVGLIHKLKGACAGRHNS